MEVFRPYLDFHSEIKHSVRDRTVQLEGSFVFLSDISSGIFHLENALASKKEEEEEEEEEEIEGKKSLEDLAPSVSRASFARPGCQTPKDWSPIDDHNAAATRIRIGPLRIDVTVTAKWPLWVLRNVTPFTPSHFRQSSEQIFLVLVFVFSKRFFWNLFPVLREQHI